MKRYLLPTLLSLFTLIFFSCTKSNTDSSKVLSTEEFIKYNVNGTDYSFIMPVDSLLANRSDSVENPSIEPWNTVTANRIPNSLTDFSKIGYVKYGSAPGSMQQLRLFYSTQTGIYPYPTTSLNPVMVNITEYGNVGEYIAGNLSALFIGPPPGNIQYNVICSFRVKRRI